MKLLKAKSILTKLFLIVFGVIGLANITLAQEGNLPTTPFVDLLNNTLSWLVGLVVIVSLIIIVVAGLQWAMASGDEEKIEKARRWLIGAVTGLLIALAAWAIVNVVFVNIFRTGGGPVY